MIYSGAFSQSEDDFIEWEDHMSSPDSDVSDSTEMSNEEDDDDDGGGEDTSVLLQNLK